MHELYSEMFDRFANVKTKQEKAAILRSFSATRHGSRLPYFLFLSLSPKIKFDIEKYPEYKPSKLAPGMNDTYIHNELSKVYLFIDHHPRRIHKLTQKREQAILTQIFESLHADEAVIFKAMMTKTLSNIVKGLTPSFAKEIFPNELKDI